MSQTIYPKEDLTITPVTSPFVCEISSNGTQWTKRWSNGWVEQGGYFSGLYNSNVGLWTPMANTNYTIVTTKCTGGNDSSSYVINAYNKNTTYFTVNGRGQGGKGYGSNATGHWIVQGWSGNSPNTSNNIYITAMDSNGQSWYKRYSNGWVEQGGWCGGFEQWIGFWIRMANTNYTLITGKVYGSDTRSSAALNTYNKQTTGFSATGWGQGGGSYREGCSGQYVVYGWGG